MMQQARRRVELEAAQAAADRSAAQDALTGLGNRRQFDLQIAAVDESYTLVLVDVDHFKTINDTYSHQTGDRILREVAAVLRAHCRAEDSAVRLGGDEFALFLRTDPAGAAHVAERVREVLAARDWSAFGASLRVTLSIGVAQCARGMDGATLYDRADHQLYNAKRRGRDQVAV
jgi:diguanylate cyclase